MSKTKLPAGVEERHARSCRAPEGRCSCTPTYRAQVWDAKASKPIKKTFPTKSAARQWRTDAQSAVRAGEVSAERGPRLRHAMEAWLDAMRAGQARNRSGRRFKPAAIRAYERAVRLRVMPALGDLRVDDVTPPLVQAWIDSMVKDELAPATIDTSLTALRSFYRRAVSRGEARSNPCGGLEKPAVERAAKRIVEPAVAAKMIEALSGADKVLWAVAFYTGLRRGELIALRWSAVDLAAGYVHVVAGWDDVEGEIEPKSKQGRRKVPIPAVLRDHLDEHQLSSGADGRVFSDRRWVCDAGIRAAKVWEDAKLPTLTLHECRHTYASTCIAANLNAKTISTYMGHATIAITLDLYGHLMPGAQDEAMALLDAYLAREIGAEEVPTVPQTVPHPTPVAA
jgi:integrase